MIPGSTVRPWRSIRCVVLVRSASIAWLDPTASMRPPLTAIASAQLPFPVNTCPCTKIVSAAAEGRARPMPSRTQAIPRVRCRPSMLWRPDSVGSLPHGLFDGPEYLVEHVERVRHVCARHVERRLDLDEVA